MQPNNLQSFLRKNDTEAATNPMPAPEQGNWMTGLLPTAGSILGGIGGALIPVLGQTGVGEVAGATAGSAAGKALEGMLTGKQANIGDLGGAALEGGIGQLTGMGIGKVAGGVLGKLGTVGEKGAAEAAAAKAANEASQAAIDKATAYKNNYGSISGRLQQDLKLGENAKLIDQLGFDSTDPTHMKTVSDAGFDLNRVYDTALQGAKPVAMGDFGNTVFNDMQKRGITDLGATPLGKAISEAGVPLNQKGLELPAVQVRKLQQAIGTQIGNTKRVINNAELLGQTNTEAESNLKTLQDVYKGLGEKIKTPEVNKFISGAKVSDEGRQGLIEKYGEKLGNHTADLIDNAQSADQLLDPMRKFTQMSHASDMALNDVNNAVGTARSVARTKADNPMLDTPEGPDVLGQMMNHASSLATGGPAGKIGVLASLGKVGAPVLKQLSSMGASIAKAGGAASIPKVGAQVVSHGGEYVNSPTGATGADMQQQQPATAMGGAQPGGDQMNAVNLASKLMEIMSVNPNQTAHIAPILAQLMPQVQKTNVADEAMQQYQGTLGAAGGPQGPLGGALSQLGGMLTGGPAAQVDPQRQAAAAALANATGMTIEQAMAALPGMQANQAGAQQGFGLGGSILGALQ